MCDFSHVSVKTVEFKLNFLSTVQNISSPEIIYRVRLSLNMASGVFFSEHFKFNLDFGRHKDLYAHQGLLSKWPYFTPVF